MDKIVVKMPGFTRYFKQNINYKINAREANHLQIYKIMPILKFWTPEKNEILKNEYQTADLNKLAERLGCTINALQKQASKIDAARVKQNWIEEDKAYLKKHFPTTDNEILADYFNKSESAIRTMAQKMKLKKSTRYWKIGQEKYVMENYGKVPIQDMQDHLQKTKWAIINKHRELAGLRKTGDKVIILS